MEPISGPWLDVVNSVFVILNSFFIALNIRKTLKDRCVKGVSLASVVFYVVWGLWNLAFFAMIGATVSFYATLAYVGLEVFWISLFWGLTDADSV